MNMPYDSETMLGNYEIHAVPAVETGIFNDNPKDQFAITHLKKNPSSQDESNLLAAYHRLRAQVYIDEMGFLDTESKDQRKQEIDQDDDRSEHFIVVENRLGLTAIVACLRLIDYKADRPLPVEDLYPDAFDEEQIQPKSIEVSRFITRYEDKKTRHMIRDLMFASALAYINESDKGPAYAIVEPELENHLVEKVGIPLQCISDYRWIEEYKSKNAAIRIDTTKMLEKFGAEILSAAYINQGDYLYWGAIQEQSNEKRAV